MKLRDRQIFSNISTFLQSFNIPPLHQRARLVQSECTRTRVRKGRPLNERAAPKYTPRWQHTLYTKHAGKSSNHSQREENEAPELVITLKIFLPILISSLSLPYIPSIPITYTHAGKWIITRVRKKTTTRRRDPRERVNYRAMAARSSNSSAMYRRREWEWRCGERSLLLAARVGIYTVHTRTHTPMVDGEEAS